MWRVSVQGYLAHKKQPPPPGPPQGPRHTRTVWSCGRLVSYERGTPEWNDFRAWRAAPAKVAATGATGFEPPAVERGGGTPRGGGEHILTSPRVIAARGVQSPHGAENASPRKPLSLPHPIATPGA